MTVAAFPLHWPIGWPRTEPHKQDSGQKFRKPWKSPREPGRDWTFVEARDALLDELVRLKASDVVLSSNYRVGAKGAPVFDKRRPDDEGIAVYFTRKGRTLVIACDSYTKIEANMRSMALAIDAMRQLERHGGGVMMDRAFDGFAALPAPGAKHWTEILGVSRDATLSEIDAAYRRLAAERHPDRPGGSDAMMAELNRARDEARQEKQHG